MKRSCIFVACLLMPLPVFAQSTLKEFGGIDDITITYGGWTYHMGGTQDRNQDNYIWGVRYKEFEALTMINSFDSRSYIFAYHKKWQWTEWADVGFRVGGMTGYSKEENSIQLFGITPVISPTINFHYKGFGFETSLQANVLVFSLNYTF